MWVGMDVWGATICFNTVEAQKRGLPKPESWKDLLKPIYKGQITMPHPASSGTGFLDVTAWLQLYGEAEGWKYMDALHENIAQYVHSGSKPCRQAGAGEFVMGISFEYRANATKASGAPVDLVFPKEGVGWDMEAAAIMKSTKKLDAARKVMDWAATREANELYAKSYAIVAMPGVAKPLPNVPANYEQMLVKNDFGWAARTAIASSPSGTSAITQKQSPSDLALSVEGVSKHFGPFVALRDVSLSVRHGELVCFLGPSGCGKTTLLRIIAGLETQSAGRIVQNGRDISRCRPRSATTASCSSRTRSFRT